MKSSHLLVLITTVVIALSAFAGTKRSQQIAKKARAEAEAIASGEEDAPEVELTTITAEDLQVMIDTTKPLMIVDARAAEDFKAGHIPGALNLRARDATAQKWTELAPDKGTTLIFYCVNPQSPASAKAAYKAALAGYTKLYRYTAGIEDWRAKGMPIVSDDAVQTPNS